VSVKFGFQIHLSKNKATRAAIQQWGRISTDLKAVANNSSQQYGLLKKF
jgi:hypothetical protein